MKGTDMEATGLEPVTSRVWGERSSRLSYGSKYLIILQPPGKSVNRRAWFNVKLQDAKCLLFNMVSVVSDILTFAIK